MWWCCGKRGKDQAGCKFSKHESKDDDLDEPLEEEERLRMDSVMLKNVRCLCCKETGHRIENCTRDPNFVTNKAPL
jgi:hypothetical protein